MSGIASFFDSSDAQVAAAKASILERTSEDSPCGRFCSWIVENHSEIYAIFLEYSYARLASDVLGMSGLLNTIHHALVDDGEISFVDLGIHGPRAVFLWKGESNFDALIRDIFSRNGVWAVIAETVEIGEPYDDIERFMREVETHLEQSRIRMEGRESADW